MLASKGLAGHCVETGIDLEIRAMENHLITHRFGRYLNKKQAVKI
ncbi:exonuclease III [Actinobacillus equuli]|nr:exonuclease III [Actinobacillus equuli]